MLGHRVASAVDASVSFSKLSCARRRPGDTSAKLGALVLNLPPPSGSFRRGPDGLNGPPISY
ncbi:Hypothetical protein A7982_01443 [Minicystis rosea]|nr:Hypothetical protein A7982_01443 [Minicystis rosea]